MDVISRLKMLEVYTEPVEIQRQKYLVKQKNAFQKWLQTQYKPLIRDRLHAEQMKDTNFTNLATQSHCKNRNSFNLVVISTYGLPQKQQCIHGLKHDAVVAPHSILPTIHEIDNLKSIKEPSYMASYMKQ